MNLDKAKKLIDKMDISNILVELLLGGGYKGVLRDMIQQLKQDETRILKAAFQDVIKDNSYEMTNKDQKSIEEKIGDLDKRCLRGTRSQSEIADSICGAFECVKEEETRNQICDAVARQYIEKRKDMDELFDLAQVSQESLKILKQISRNELHHLTADKQYPSFTLELKADLEEAEEFRNVFSEDMGFDYEEIYLSESERGNEFTMVHFEFWEDKNQDQLIEFIDQLNEVLVEEKLHFVGWQAE